ncbi:DUF983 domain-containing protein [Novosphingobium bradum]|uniref:DUF983 domain-containing protein n=1 Tax=Novosphingobium bradum TaxID=1737444 RepID=A0ABV7IWE9_9SPHN
MAESTSQRASAPPPATAGALPSGFGAAMARGLRCTCPRCGAPGLFRRWLKPVDRCAACDMDWSLQRADDFPAYIAIIVTGHLLAPIMIALATDAALGPLGLAAVLFPSAIAMMLGLLQPAKGVVIALQWWHGMHGFVRERAGG